MQNQAYETSIVRFTYRYHNLLNSTYIKYVNERSVRIEATEYETDVMRINGVTFAGLVIAPNDLFD